MKRSDWWQLSIRLALILVASLGLRLVFDTATQRTWPFWLQVIVGLLLAAVVVGTEALLRHFNRWPGQKARR